MNTEKLYNVLLAPRVTEKTARVGEQGNQYVFRVATDATKADIRAAVEHLFDVNVESVQVTNVKGKTKSFKLRAGKRADWKKAYVRVQEGQVIDLLGDAV
jgi:large subunit ribosomal protein L23